MATFRINFTRPSLDKIAPPVLEYKEGKGGVYDTYYDTKEKGLVLLVSHGGAKTYYLYKKINGRPERIKLGSFHDISLDKARQSAALHKGKIAEGKNPQQEKRAFKKEATLQELFTEYLERYSKKHKKSWRYDEREINKFLSHWFNRKISTITKQEVQRLHESIMEENGLYQANRLLERLRAMYNKAIEWGWQGANPAAGVSKFREKSRDRFLQPYELPYFFEALKAEGNDSARDYILLSLLTGARKANVLSMRWDEVNLNQAEWRIPETKNGEPLTVPLSQSAVDILKTRKSSTSSLWVFPSLESKRGYLQDPKKAWNRLLKRAETYQLIDLVAAKESWSNSKIEKARSDIEGDINSSLNTYQLYIKRSKIELPHVVLKGVRIHDLRRSLGSWQAVTGASQYIIGKSLGHKSQQATAVYARLNLDPVRDSIERATAAMMQAGKGK